MGIKKYIFQYNLKQWLFKKSEIEEILGRIKTHKNVEGYIITNFQGDIIKSSYTGDKKVEGDKILSNIPELVHKT